MLTEADRCGSVAGDVAGRALKKCIVRPLFARISGFDEDSSRKCIRPLDSGLGLKPSHDEIRVRRSSKLRRAESTGSMPGLTTRRSTVSPLFLEPRSLPNGRSRRDRIAPGLVSITKATRATFAASAIVTLLDIHAGLEASSQAPSRFRFRSRWITQDRAPWIRSLRTSLSARLLMPSSGVLPPVESCRDTSPIPTTQRDLVPS